MNFVFKDPADFIAKLQQVTSKDTVKDTLKTQVSKLASQLWDADADVKPGTNYLNYTDDSFLPNLVVNKYQLTFDNQKTDQKTITRTINVTKPDGKVTSKKQEATLKRTGIIKDLKTGKITWGDWSKGEWPEFAAPLIKNYTASPAKIDSQKVTHETTNKVVDIKYIANTESVSDSKTVTRTINITNPQTSKVSSNPQEVTLTRTGIKNLATGDISWNDWTTGEWPEFLAPSIKNYTASPAKIDSQKVTHETTNKVVDIKYIANTESVSDSKTVTRTINITNPQTSKVSSNPQEVTLTRTGIKNLATGDISWNDWTTGEWPEFLAPSIKNYTASPAKIDSQKVTHETTNKVVDIKYVANIKSVDDSKTITRTINITDPDGKVTTTTQPVTLTRTGTKNLATSHITWNPWSTGEWPAYVIPAIDGYTPIQSKVDAQAVTSDTQDQTITITYEANPQSILVIYKDGNKIVHTDTVNGKTAETVNLNIQIPEGYKLQSDIEVPTTYTFKSKDNQNITVPLTHDTSTINDQKSVTRTINITTPDGKITTIPQVATLKRTGTKDLVTGQITWGNWSTNEWPEYLIPVVNGYTASQLQVVQEVVTSTTADTVVNIYYVQNPVQPNNPEPVQPDVTTPNTPSKPNQSTPVNSTLESPAQHTSDITQSRGTHIFNNNESAKVTSQSAHHSANALPQTGNTDQKVTSLLGLLSLSVVTMLGIHGRKRHFNSNN